MKILMVHEVLPEFLDLDLSNFDIITFDDGLYSQFLNIDHFLNFNKRIIMFISSNILRPENVKPSKEILNCAIAHNKAFSGNFENYISVSELLELSKKVEIGCHSHNHLMYKNSAFEYNNFKDDTLKSLEFFKNLNIKIKSFCFPYNQNETNKIYETYIKSLGLEIFGYNRIAIENLKNLKI